MTATFELLAALALLCFVLAGILTIAGLADTARKCFAWALVLAIIAPVLACAAAGAVQQSRINVNDIIGKVFSFVLLVVLLVGIYVFLCRRSCRHEHDCSLKKRVD